MRRAKIFTIFTVMLVSMLVLGMSKPTILKKMREKKLKFDGNGGRGG